MPYCSILVDSYADIRLRRNQSTPLAPSLIELRGETSREFALYRIMRGRADKMFVSGGGYYGAMSSQ